ncbi:hypothetical protein C0995_008318 [Termitomyces sp. Mi166|nr:hypothetical protein C0995_008318 [Termitomyces sp. Mi166\
MLLTQCIAITTLLSALLLTSGQALTDVTYDYAIVGGGTAGLALATRLSEDPSLSIIVLEAGGNPNITDLRLSQNNLGSSVDWQFVTVPQVDAGGRTQDQAQGKVLGGGSAINAGMYTRQALDTTFNPTFHGFSGPIAISTQALNISRFFPQIVVPTLRSLGFNLNFDSNGGNHKGPSWNYLTTFPDTSTRSYAVSGYYRPIANRSNLRVLTESQVSRIIWSVKKTDTGLLNATSVEYLALDSSDGSLKKMLLNASNVILSAGALNTPKLLELSGLGDADILGRVGIDVKIDLPGVGAKPMQSQVLRRLRN